MAHDIHDHRILNLDFGSQYTQLIARRVRDIGVYCEVRAFDISMEELEAFNPKGILLAGGPESVTELGGRVASSEKREFGYAQVKVRADAEERFLTNLKGVSDPEQKRKVIGNTFIDVFDEEASRI